MITNFKRTRYVPEAYTEVIEKPFDIKVHYSTELKKAMLYVGKSTKPLWHYRYSSVESMMKSINDSIERVTANKQRDLDDRTAKTLATKNMKAADHFSVGDIVKNSWGYEQTNVECYQVIRVLNKKIEVQEIYQQDVEGSHGHDSCNVLPVKDGFIKGKEPFQLLLKVYIYNGKESVSICNPKSYYYFSKWSGGPIYKSWGY